LLRPGRFDRILYVGPPDELAREEILKIRMRKMSIGQDVDVKEIAKLVSRYCRQTMLFSLPSSHCLPVIQTEGCSGADISSLCQEAAMLTMQQDMNSSHVRT